MEKGCQENLVKYLNATGLRKVKHKHNNGNNNDKMHLRLIKNDDLNLD